MKTSIFVLSIFVLCVLQTGCLATTSPTTSPTASPTASPTTSQTSSTLAPTAVAGTPKCLSRFKVRQMQSAIRAHMAKLAPFSSGGSLELADFLGAVVRLSFHDAGTWDKTAKNGGPDGCLDLTDHENKGFTQVLSVLDYLHTPFKKIISRADFWVLAANTALEYSAVTKNGASLKMAFRYGRVDCAGNEYIKTIDAGRLPQADKDWSHLKEVFIDRMGFTYQELAALSGAHTLGRAELGNSGFVGPWVTSKTSERFDSGYFIQLLLKWEKKPNSAGNDQWQFSGDNASATAAMLLTSDVALVFSAASSKDCKKVHVTEENTSNGSYTCGVVASDTDAACKVDEEHLKELCKLKSEKEFFPIFASAMKKLQELGHEEKLREPGICFDGESLPQGEEDGKIADPVSYANKIVTVTVTAAEESRCIAVKNGETEPTAFQLMMGRAGGFSSKDPYWNGAACTAPIQTSDGKSPLWFDLSGCKTGEHTVYCGTWREGTVTNLNSNASPAETPPAIPNKAKKEFDAWAENTKSENDSANVAFIVSFTLMIATGVAWVLKKMCTKKKLDPALVEKLSAETEMKQR